MFLPTAESLYAEDGCPTGKGPTGSSKHITAFFLALEEFVGQDFTRPFLSCTCKQSWNQPRQRNLDTQTMYEISFLRTEHEKWRNHTPSYFNKTFIPYPWNIVVNSLMQPKSCPSYVQGCLSRVAFLSAEHWLKSSYNCWTSAFNSFIQFTPATLLIYFPYQFQPQLLLPLQIEFHPCRHAQYLLFITLFSITIYPRSKITR